MALYYYILLLLVLTYWQYSKTITSIKILEVFPKYTVNFAFQREVQTTTSLKQYKILMPLTAQC